jgi:3-oxoacyl-[acyl-carrier-protein] synthase-3
LFGDGAGAFILQSSEEPGGILSSYLRSDGSGAELLMIPGGGSKNPASMDTVQQGLHFIQMNGREVFRFATRVMSRATKEVVERSRLRISDISLVVPHQANIRIIEAAAKGLKMPKERFAINIGRYGNTSTASIPIAVTEAFEDGRLQSGDHIVLVGFGAGLTWGAVALTWTGPFPEREEIDVRRYQLMGRIRGFVMRWIRRVEGVLHRWTRRY